MPDVSTISVPFPRPRTSARGAITWRSVPLGLLGACLVCGLGYYNDFAVANTFLVGNYLPVGLVLCLLVVVLLVNTPLHRWRPTAALNPGELAVMTCMTMVACSLPSSGLMRYLPPSIAGMHVEAAQNSRYIETLRQAGAADWLFPSFKNEDVGRRVAEPIFRDFYNRTPGDRDSFGDYLGAVPWRAWLRPAIAWGLFVGSLLGAVLCLGAIVHRQWADNERLAFPLAGVYLALIEPPAEGRTLNAVFGSPWFWLAAATVFVLHGFDGLHAYFPRQVPALPLAYDLRGGLADPPFSALPDHVKRAAVYFSVVGVTFFLAGGVSFSLWFAVIAYAVATMFLRQGSVEVTDVMHQDQALGALVVFGATAFYVGRQHWAMVGRHMLGRRQSDEPRGEFLPYDVAGWTLVACVAAMWGWLCLAGMTMWAALWLVGFVLLAYVAIARVVAETGLVFVQLRANPLRAWQYLLPAIAQPPSAGLRTSYFMTAWTNQLLTHDMREGAGPFVQNGLYVGDKADRDVGRPRHGLAFVGCLALALAVGFVVSGAATLLVEYNYATTLDVRGEYPVNRYGTSTSTVHMLNIADGFFRGGSPESHYPAKHVAGGAAAMLALSVMRLRFAWWPLHPVGFLLVYTEPMRVIWFSVLIGWATKAVLVRFGGPAVLRSARPAFVGLIVGEAGAAAFWLVVSIALNAMGKPYVSVPLLPQ